MDILNTKKKKMYMVNAKFCDFKPQSKTVDGLPAIADFLQKYIKINFPKWDLPIFLFGIKIN